MSSFEFEKELRVTETGIPGLKVVDLPVHGDARGWFKENWQRAKMVAAGLPDFRPVQNNVSFNASRGVTRGIHAEPWDKYISVATGSVFGAWVDLRPGATFGRVFTTTLDPSRAIFVPRGVGNSFQALEDGTAYTYLVDAHWSAELKVTYTFVNLADPALGIDWPIPLSEATLSEADLAHPMLADALPMAPRRTLVTGCNGQLGHAVRELAEARGLAGSFDFCDIDGFDFSDPAQYGRYDWSLYGAVINCGAYTAVERAESEGGATVFGYHVDDPERFGVVEFDENLNAVSIEEKPAHPKSSYAVTGLYFYGSRVCEFARRVRPSARGELEITDLNRMYLEDGSLSVVTLGRGYAWLDTGTMESLYEAGDFVRAVERAQDTPVSVLEEIAFENGWIGRDTLVACAERYGKSEYGRHLRRVAEGKIIGDRAVY